VAIKDISQVCDRCGGDGIEETSVADPPAPPTTRTCEACDGVGFTIHGQLDDDLIDFLNDLKDKVDDIFEKVNE